MAVRVGILQLEQDVDLLALVLDRGDVVEMQDAVLQLAGDHGRRRAAAQADLLGVVDLGAVAFGQHRAQRHRARAAD